MLIYLTDDDEGVRKLLSLILKRAGYAVHATENPAELLAWISQGEKPNVIITDYEMPTMTGTKLTQLLRRDGYRGHVILVSGLRFEHLPTGVDHTLRKPLDTDELLATIRQLKNVNGSR